MDHAALVTAFLPVASTNVALYCSPDHPWHEIFVKDQAERFAKEVEMWADTDGLPLENVAREAFEDGLFDINLRLG